MSMGNPSAAAIANIFMGDLEKKMLSECSIHFKPLFYHRYLNDTFVVYKEAVHADLIPEHINSYHSAIKYTVEKENIKSLPFLNIDIVKHVPNQELSGAKSELSGGTVGVCSFHRRCGQVPYNLRITHLWFTPRSLQVCLLAHFNK